MTNTGETEDYVGRLLRCRAVHDALVNRVELTGIGQAIPLILNMEAIDGWRVQTITK